MKLVKILRQQERLNKLKGTPRPNNKRDKEGLARWMRANPTPSEALFLKTWQSVSSVKIRDQAVMLGFIVDFYARNKKLIIEIDGVIHEERKDYDACRDEIFRNNGYNVLRIQASDVMNDPVDAVMKAITYMQNCEKLKPTDKTRLRLPDIVR